MPRTAGLGLIEPGVAAFGEDGYGPTTIEAPCRASGVTARNFYEHLATREALLVAVYEAVGVSPAMEARRLQAIEEYTKLVEAVADDLHARGLAPGPGRRIASRAIVGALTGLVELWLATEPPPASAELRAEATLLALAALG